MTVEKKHHTNFQCIFRFGTILFLLCSSLSWRVSWLRFLERSHQNEWCTLFMSLSVRKEMKQNVKKT